MNRSLSTTGVMLLATLLLAVQVPAAGALRGSLGLQAAPDAPEINIWYGSPQAFGTPGNPQRQINILGNASGASTLHYSLNGGPDVELAMGGGSAAAPSAGTGIRQPDQGQDSLSVRGALGDPGPMAPRAALALLATASPRLVSPGDFNTEINTTDLNDGANTVVIKANGGLTSETVTVNYSAGYTWPQPYTIDWDDVTDIRDVVQVVDGQWAKDGDNIRTMSTGYDRIVALGDVGWDDFQVTVPVTIHAFPDPNAGGVGVVARWQGHFQIDDEQPGRGWWQIGAYGFYRNRDANNGGPKLAIYTGHYDILKDVSGYRVPLNTPHFFKLRAQTQVPGESGFYSFKAWRVGTDEPEDWVFEIQDAPPDEMFNGSVLLVAHEVDASFGDVEILPVLDVNVDTVGNGSVQVGPALTGPSDAYLFGDTIELTATPDAGWVFAGWSGSLSGADNPASLMLADDAAVTATFVPAQGFNLDVSVVGSGGVALDPAGGIYVEATVVTLAPQPGAGWQFAGWSGPDVADLIDRGAGAWEITMDGDKAIAAAFTQAEYTLATSVTGSGTVAQDPDQATYHYGDEVQLTAQAAAGWTFTGWNGDMAGRDNPATLTVDGNMAVTALFSDNSQSGAIDIQVAASEDDAEESLDTGSVAIKGVDLELGEDRDPQIVGLRFQDVQIPPGAIISRATIEFSVDETYSGATNLTFRAQASDNALPFDGSDYHLSGRPKTTVSAAWNDVEPWTTVHDSHQSADLSPIIQEVVNRSGWSEGNALAIFVTGSGRRTAESYNGAPALAPRLRVEYGGEQQTCYTLSTGVDPATSGAIIASPEPNCIAAGGAGYTAGTQVQLTAQANTGWIFTGWSGDLSGSDNPVLLTMDGDKTAIANLAQDEYTLTVNTTGSGAVSKDPDQTSYHHGDQVQLTATAGVDWTFAGWSGDLSGSDNPALLTMDGDKSVTAAFVQGGYTLTVDLAGSGSVSVDPDQASYPPGTQVQLTAQPDPGWSFGNWSGDLIGTENPATLTMDADKTVTASFGQDGPTGVLDRQVAASDDDAEERLDRNSVAVKGVDLELGEDRAPQIVGLRFQNIEIPPGAVISVAYVEFSADETHAGYTDLSLQAQASDDAAAFFGRDGDLSNRPKTAASAAWNGIEPWATVHDSYRSADLSAVIQEVVSRPGWSAGNSLAIFVTGSGRRTAESYDGASALAPKLHVEYGGGQQTCYTLSASVAPAISGAISASPEPNCIAAGGAGYTAGTQVQLTAQTNAGWTFGGWGGDLAGSDNPSTVSMDGDRSVTASFDQEAYSLAVNTTGDGTVARSPDQQTYHFGDQVQLTAVPGPGWHFIGWNGDHAGSDNPTTLTIDGDMAVTAAFSEGGQITTVDVQVAASGDDAEERIDRGSVALKGVDLELGEDRAPQIVGLRFSDVTVPQGATVTNAYVEFSADETHSDPTDLVFHAQASDDAASFADDDYHLSSRPRTAASAAWNDVEAWTTVHDVYRSTDLKAIIQEVVSRPGWAAGNALALFVTGSGRRTAESYNGASPLAPRLRVSFERGN